MINMNENDKKILTILWKLQWASAEDIALLIDEPTAYVNRRCLQFNDAKLIGREYLAGGVLSCNYITKKGMREAGLPERRVSVPSLYNYEHTRGEIDMYLFLTLYPKTNIKFGNIITERDILSSIVWDDAGVNSQGRKKVSARDIGMGIHRPDGYVITEKGENQTFTALEYERSRKSKKSNSHLLDNMNSNAKCFNGGQFWFYDGQQIKNKLTKHQQPEHKIHYFNQETAREFLKKRKEQLPGKLSIKEEREPIDYIGFLYEPVPLNELPRRQFVELEK